VDPSDGEAISGLWPEEIPKVRPATTKTTCCSNAALPRFRLKDSTRTENSLEVDFRISEMI
jgi:hypothetical protein